MFGILLPGAWATLLPPTPVAAVMIESPSIDRGVSAEFEAVEIGPPTPMLLLFIIIIQI